MSVYFRYIGIVLAVLVFAVIFMVCGEGACVECAHACCVRADRTDRITTILSRVLSACGLRGYEATGSLARWSPHGALHRVIGGPLLKPPLALSVSPLRI